MMLLLATHGLAVTMVRSWELLEAFWSLKGASKAGSEASGHDLHHVPFLLRLYIMHIDIGQ